MHDVPTDRCFIAVWPDNATATQLDQLAARLHAEHPGSRRVERANLHLTLAFIGPLPVGLQEVVVRELEATKVIPFDWRIDQVGAFARARVLWAASATAHPHLSTLARNVRSLLHTLDIGYDQQPFRPHVTLLRRLPRSRMAGIACGLDRPICWTVCRPVLLRSVSTSTGVRYVEPRPIS
jgi:RNA 2',3'-cyclic 3'-phosphodiesterase